MRLGEANARVGIEVIPTGALGLDLATGRGRPAARGASSKSSGRNHPAKRP